MFRGKIVAAHVDVISISTGLTFTIWSTDRMAKNHIKPDSYDLAAADEFITGKPSRTKAPKAKKPSYSRACAVAARFLRERGVVFGVPTPKATDLAIAIRRNMGAAGETPFHTHAKMIVMEFAARLAGVPAIPAAVNTKEKQPAAIRQDRSSDFYWSDAWRRLRYQALRASNGECELCHMLPSRGKPLHVDHIKPRSKYPELELDPKNLQVLCYDCNLGKGNTDEIDWRRKSAG